MPLVAETDTARQRRHLREDEERLLQLMKIWIFKPSHESDRSPGMALCNPLPLDRGERARENPSPFRIMIHLAPSDSPSGLCARLSLPSPQTFSAQPEPRLTPLARPPRRRPESHLPENELSAARAASLREFPLTWLINYRPFPTSAIVSNSINHVTFVQLRRNTDGGCTFFLCFKK